MQVFSADPLAGARRAYLALNPADTDREWENWFDRLRRRSADELGTFAALSLICNECILQRAENLELSVVQHVAWSAGYYEAMASIAEILRSAGLSENPD